MRGSTLLLGSAAAVLTIVALTKCAPADKAVTASAAVTPAPIPSGLGYPVPAATIDGWVARGDVASERTHAWVLWKALNTGSRQFSNGNELRIWETWESISAVLASANVQLNAEKGGPAPELRAFASPRQFTHMRNFQKLAATPSPVPNNTNTAFAVLTKFDPSAAQFVRTPQPGPGPAGTKYDYRSIQSLNALNAAFPSTTGYNQRAINPFPTSAFELKPVMMSVKATGLTIQPIWRGPSGSTRPQNPTQDTWTTCVLIDPAGSGSIRPATPAEVTKANPSKSSACKTYLYGPVSLFYSFKMSAAEAKSFNAASGGNAAAGDYGVLVGMHVNTKETKLWTWQTYWWQPGDDAPGGFPGTKAGQPSDLPAPFNNYASCTAYSQTLSPTNNQMTVCFNPYLETDPSIPVGVTSNCMSCHGVAMVGTPPPSNQGYPLSYATGIQLFQDQRYFSATTTNTDMSWALVH